MFVGASLLMPAFVWQIFPQKKCGIKGRKMKIKIRFHIYFAKPGISFHDVVYDLLETNLLSFSPWRSSNIFPYLSFILLFLFLIVTFSNFPHLDSSLPSIFTEA